MRRITKDAHRRAFAGATELDADKLNPWTSGHDYVNRAQQWKEAFLKRSRELQWQKTVEEYNKEDTQ